MVNSEPQRRTQAERSATTRGRLIEAAITVFAEKGYADAGREEIVAAAGVTRGAMYHHFADKADLFRAAYETIEHRVMEAVGAAAMSATDPVEMLRRGCQAYLDIALDAPVRRICLIDAPAVLDAQVRQEISGGHALGYVREGLAAAVQGGQIPDQPVDALAHTLLAAVMAAAEYVVSADDPDQARADAGQVVDNLLDGLTRR